MRQNLFYIPHEIDSLGLPVFGYGVALVLWAVVCAAWLAWLVRRHGWSGETTGALPVMAGVALAIVFLAPLAEVRYGDRPLGLPIRGYGVLLLAAIVAGIGAACYRARRMGVPVDTILSLAMWVFVAGIIGARLFFVVQYWPQFVQFDAPGGFSLAATLARVVNVAEGGLVVYGSVIGGILAGIVFVRRHGLPKYALADLVAPSVVLGMGIGRLGCLLNGCCYGGVCDGCPLAITFPAARPPWQAEESPPYFRHRELGLLHGFRLARDAEGRPVIGEVRRDTPAAAAGLPAGDVVLAIDGWSVATLAEAQAHLRAAGPEIAVETSSGPYRWSIGALPPRSLPVQPTQIYAAIDGLLLFFFGWVYYPFRRTDGEVAAWLLTLYPITRFLMEIVRADEGGQFGTGLTISQLISLGMLALGGYVWWRISRAPAMLAWPPATAADAAA